MRRTLIAGATLAVGAMFAGAARADTVTPFPSPTVPQVFVAAQTVTPEGAMKNFFAPGETVIFRAYAVDAKTHKAVTAKEARYFYVAIPSLPNVQLKYDPSAPGATSKLPWTGTWTVPANYQAGVVNFKTLVQLSKANGKRRGSFVQFPVASAQLTIAGSPPPTFTSPVTGSTGAASSGAFDLSLYVDSVNGTRPAGAAPRAAGCSQTNVFKRGEQLVLRVWGTEMATSNVLSTDNIKEAHFSVAGQPDVVLNWGSHGATGAKVWFWSNQWQIPKDFPLGETTVHAVFTLESGKVGTYDHVINVIP